MKGKTYKAVIVDDETYCIDNIVKSLNKYPEIQIIACVNNANCGIDAIVTNQPDLLFLDVEMPEQNGFEMLKQLEYRITWNMQVVFHTAFNNYLLDALRNSAFDFLLKPYYEAEFDEMIKRFLKQTNKTIQTEQYTTSFKELINKNHSFMATTGKGFKVLNVEDIVLFEYNSTKRIWTVKLNDLSALPLKRGTNADEIEKYSPSFIRISQNIIINFEFLSYIELEKCILIAPFDTISLKISRNYMSSLQKKFEMI